MNQAPTQESINRRLDQSSAYLTINHCIYFKKVGLMNQAPTQESINRKFAELSPETALYTLF
jgi:hypothetical protein